MKRLLLMYFATIVSLHLFAQNDVIKFMGIPVDGTKTELESKLIEKGFKLDKEYDFLTGIFNGENVNLKITTYKDKVWRICVLDNVSRDEREIKIRFNNLVYQFSNNKKYTAASDKDFMIPDNEDIYWGIKSKRYEANFFQIGEPDESLKKTHDYLLTKYKEEEIKDSANNLRKDVLEEGMNYYSNLIRKKTVWFMIQEIDNKYVIVMFYENLWNHNIEEDL